MNQRFVLAHDTARQRAAQAVVSAPEGYEVLVKEPTRSSDQNAKLHALLTDVARHCKYLGKTLTADQWKVLFVSGHAIATGKGAEILPGIEGEFVNVRESTARMSKARASSLIEYIYAWVSEQGYDIAE